jgi:hypothetical protein
MRRIGFPSMLANIDLSREMLRRAMKLNLLRDKRDGNGEPGQGRPGAPSARVRARLAQAVDWLAKESGEWTDHDLASRVLIATGGAKAQTQGLAFARTLAAHGDPTLLIDTAQGSLALSSLMELPRSPGLAELCQGRARFAEVIRRDPASSCQFLASGRPRSVGGAWGEPGEADRVFRALDESYRWLLFCASLDEALGLAANIRRQFETAILIDDAELRRRHPFLSDIFSRYKLPVYRLPAD